MAGCRASWERSKIATFDSATAPHAKRMAAKTATISIAILGVVRSEGLEPPRCYPLPPQGSASTNSATSAKEKPEPEERGTGSVAPVYQIDAGGTRAAQALNPGLWTVFCSARSASANAPWATAAAFP